MFKQFGHILCALALSQISFAQEIIEDDPPVSTKNKFISFEFSPQITDSYQRTKSDDGLYQFIAEFNNEILKPKFSFSAGSSILFSLSDRLLINPGIIYINKGGKDFFELNSVFPSATTPVSIAHTYSLHYINFPVLLRFNFFENVIKFYGNIGIVPNLSFFSSTKSKSQYSDGTITTTKSANTSTLNINLSGNVGFGMGFAINPVSSFSFEPNFEYGIFDFTRFEIKNHLWSAGIKFSYIRLLGK